MLKTILIFIKAHAVATTIAATVIVGTAVATPIVASNYTLDKNVRNNLSMLVSSDYKVENNNATNILNNNEIFDDNKQVNFNEPLTFRIEKVEIGIEEIEYKIVPSYDKDYSEWTRREKEAYQRALEDIAKMAEDQYQKAAKSEQQTLEDVTKEVEKFIAKIDASYSKNYYLRCFHRSDGRIVGVDWKYNSYTELYSNLFQYDNPYQEKYEVVTKEFGGLDNGIPITGVTREEFRNKLYPKLVQIINQELSKEERKEELDKLNELYHLSD